jgi:hypothetical protein
VNDKADYERRLAKALTILEEKGISRARYAPFPFVVARWLGLGIRPPHFAPVLGNVVFLGASFGLMLFVMECGAAALMPSVVQKPGIAGWLVGSLVFGGLSAAGYAYTARHNSLPSWAELE